MAVHPLLSLFVGHLADIPHLNGCESALLAIDRLALESVLWLSPVSTGDGNLGYRPTLLVKLSK